MNLTPHHGKILLAGSVRLPSRLLTCATLGLLLSAWGLRAQDNEPSPFPNGFNPMPVDQTNDTMQVEDLISAIRSLVPDESAPGEEPGSANPNSFERKTNEASPGNPTEGQSAPRPSGRESRSRWSSRQKTNSTRGGSSTDSSQVNPGTNGGPVSLDYSAFRLVVDRNIFDPNRRPNRPNYQPPPQPSRDPEFFTLVGIMSYEEGTFAFFSGSKSDYQRSLKRAGTIAGYKVTAIGSDVVRLARNTNEVELRVGMQMRRDEDGSWSKSGSTSYTVSSFEPPPASTSASPSGAASSGAESEILKRLMEKREKE